MSAARKLVEAMRVGAGAAARQERLHLQARLAYSAARSDIECECDVVNVNTSGVWWYDLTTAEGEAQEHVATAARYLDLSGLLRRQVEAPHIVQIIDMPGGFRG